jgi:hypothetical protein
VGTGHRTERLGEINVRKHFSCFSDPRFPPSTTRAGCVTLAGDSLLSLSRSPTLSAMHFNPAAFFDPDGPWAVIGPILWLLQLGLIIHVYKTGRPYWWIYVLFIAPAIGGLAYLLLELLPEWKTNRGGFWQPRSVRIRRLRDALEEGDIVQTRLKLADELLAAGQPEEALAIANDALTGVFKDDPHTLASVARVRIEAGKPREALEALGKIDTKHDKMLDLEVTVMRGRALFATGQHHEAQTNMEAVQTRYTGEEPRYYLALSLRATGKKDEARQLLEDIVKKFRRASRAWRRSERHWFQLANAALKAER